ncbi:hypothetical protein SUGI_0909020 [Cryptomeria japonica]|uniref:uncharacterized protein LOC131052403 n=1 Tax=Cryptomeria japonica TaxID=3369 RepID=UPI002414C1FC|nr:uncharacterized protein LOC131052403 [Cryptomeria japonica]GLJ43666.1 hypothetical protein SUGI_0909020 [Cryptomeria japonica]
MRGGGSILRQFSAHKSSAKGSQKEWENTDSNSRKRVIVAVDGSKEAKHALLWALTHVVNSYDIITLLNVLDIQYNPNFTCRDGFSDVIDHAQHKRLLDARECELAKSFKGLCKSYRPQVDVEVLVTQGDRAATIVRLAKKLEASLLVLGQTRPSLFERIFGRKKGSLVQYCIDNAECLTIAVRKKSKRTGGYIINSRSQRNFWLLA